METKTGRKTCGRDLNIDTFSIPLACLLLGTKLGIVFLHDKQSNANEIIKCKKLVGKWVGR